MAGTTAHRIARIAEAEGMSERIARRAAQFDALGICDTRGARFARIMSGTPGPTLADLAAVPRWLMLDPDAQARVAKVAGLLLHRSALINELSGARLAVLADAIGEDLIDAVCAMPTAAPPATASLARPDQIIADGWRALHRGLPRPLARRFPDGANDADARILAATACEIVDPS